MHEEGTVWTPHAYFLSNASTSTLINQKSVKRLPMIDVQTTFLYDIVCN